MQQEMGGGLPLSVLTPRETQVLELIARDLSTRDIAARLYVSPKDVEYHVTRLLQKFGTRRRVGLVSRAYASGYLRLPWPPRAIPFPEEGAEPAVPCDSIPRRCSHPC